MADCSGRVPSLHPDLPHLDPHLSSSASAGSTSRELGYTLEYACLEAIQHELGRGSGVDLGAADAYSLGVTLYRLATGDMPLQVDCPDHELNTRRHRRRHERQLLKQARGRGARCFSSRCSLPGDAAILHAFFSSDSGYANRVICFQFCRRPC